MFERNHYAVDASEVEGWEGELGKSVIENWLVVHFHFVGFAATEIGFRQNVIFPGGMILEDNGEVKIYYGASDTVECLATANIDDLLKLCVDKK